MLPGLVSPVSHTHTEWWTALWYADSYKKSCKYLCGRGQKEAGLKGFIYGHFHTVIQAHFRVFIMLSLIGWAPPSFKTHCAHKKVMNFSGHKKMCNKYKEVEYKQYKTPQLYAQTQLSFRRKASYDGCRKAVMCACAIVLCVNTTNFW